MRTILLTASGALVLAMAVMLTAAEASATPIAARSDAVVADGSSFGYRCAPRRRVVVRRTYVRPTYTRVCAPRYRYRTTYGPVYYSYPRTYYAPRVRIGVGFGYGPRYYRHGHYGHRHYGHRHHGHRGHRHGGRHIGRRR